jgi:hypothetical protein
LDSRQFSEPDVGRWPSTCTHDEDGSDRRENITDWALNEFRTPYNNQKDYELGHFPNNDECLWTIHDVGSEASGE